MLALEVERARQSAEQPDPQRRVLLAERGSRLLEQLDRALVGDARAPARLLVADRGAREQLGVARSRAISAASRERGERVERLAGAVARRAELEDASRALRGLVDAELERGPQPLGRLVERERRGRRARSEQVVVDGAPRRAERRGGGEVVGEVGERAAGAAPRRLERLADAQVQLGPPRAR